MGHGTGGGKQGNPSTIEKCLRTGDASKTGTFTFKDPIHALPQDRLQFMFRYSSGYGCGPASTPDFGQTVQLSVGGVNVGNRWGPYDEYWYDVDCNIGTQDSFSPTQLVEIDVDQEVQGNVKLSFQNHNRDMYIVLQSFVHYPGLTQ